MFGKSKISICYLLLVLFALSCNETVQKKEKTQDQTEGWLSEVNDRIEKDSLNDVLFYERGKYFFESANYDLAIRDLIRAINLDSTHTKYYHLLSDASMDYYRSKEALLTMKRCVELFPDSINSLLKYSETQFILKQYDDALATCNRILLKDNQNAEAFFMMGMIFRAKNEIPKAINAFQSSTELDPDIIDSWLMLGEIYENASDPLALDYYSAAVNVDPKNIPALHIKAYYLQNNKRIPEAISIYKDIINIDKTYKDAFLNSGILYLELDSIDQALEQFNIMTKIDPTSAIGFYYKGVCFESMQNLEDAKSSYRACLNLDPKFQRAQQALDKLN